jgi:hypothetical protein
VTDPDRLAADLAAKLDHLRALTDRPIAGLRDPTPEQAALAARTPTG